MKNIPLIIASCILLSACDPVSLTALGVGAGAGVSHTMGGYTYRTFAEPLPRVRKATLTALNKMAIKVNSTDKTDNGEVITAEAGGRDIELTLESISPNTTRLRSVAHNGIFMDSATATEIIIQTEKSLPPGA